MLPMQMSPVTFKCLHTQLTATATLRHGQSVLSTAERMIPFHRRFALWFSSWYITAIITTSSCVSVTTGGYGIVTGGGGGWG